jgi:molybdopterin-guanine dinucleotide biosynthesis protein B
LLRRLSPCDLVLVEGFKTDRHPKMEIFRRALGKTPLHPEDDRIVAIASDEAFPDAGIAFVDLNDIAAVAELVMARAEPLNDVIATLES